MKAIPTRYKGYHFRSRLEARWAVFFDTAGIKWTYEPEGFLGEDGTPYLPDFLLSLSDGKAFVEIKPTVNLSAEDQRKAYQFQLALDKVRSEWTEARMGDITPSEEEDPHTLYVFAGDPYFEGPLLPNYEVLWFDYFGGPKAPDGRSIRNNKLVRDKHHWLLHCPLCLKIGISNWEPEFGYDHGVKSRTAALICQYCDIINRDWKETKDTWFYKGWVETRKLDFPTNSPLLEAAYRAARSARFEKR